MPNPTDPKPPRIFKAATLQYDKEKGAAPKLTSKGRGQVAERILAIAEEHGIPVHQDADLIEILEKTEIDTEIPLEVYAIVAEIFAYIYKVNQLKKG